MSEHDTLQDPFIHEPKGASTATAGDVYVSDGLGSGIWEPKGSNNIPYFEATIVNPTGISVVLGAGGTDLRQDADYTQFITNYTPDVDLVNQFTVDGISGEIVIPKAGIYYGSFWASISEDIGNQTLAITASKNGVYNAATKPIFQDKTRDANNISNVGGGSIFKAVAGDKIGIGAAATTAGTLLIFDSTIVLYLIQEL